MTDEETVADGEETVADSDRSGASTPDGVEASATGTGKSTTGKTANGKTTSDSRTATDESTANSEQTAGTVDADALTDPTAEGTTFTGEDLVIGYPGTDEPVIDGESVVAAPGEVTALVGPNGSGKSTLLKGLADQVEPDSGSVVLDGQDVQSLDTKELARRLGLLSQENVAPDSLTVEKLVTHGRYPHRGFFDGLTEEDRRAVDRAVDLAGIDHLRDRAVGQLSGGQKQLVWIAMVLAQETDVLLLDEPTTFLDMHHQLQVMGIVEELRDGGEMTIVVVLHDVEQAARFADYIIALDDGEVYDWGPPADVLTEQLLADVFAVDATVDHDPLRVSPRRALDDG